MAEITLKNGKAIAPKSKKKKKNPVARFFVFLLVFILLLPVILIGLVFALFYDEGHKKINVRDDYPINEVFNDIITRSLDNTKTDAKLRLRLNEDQINQVLYDALYKSGNRIEIVDNMYLEIRSNSYVFVTELNLYNFFKTRLFITTKLKTTDEKLIFKITDLKLGRMNKLDDVARFIMKHVSLPDINKKIHDAGFHMNIDIANLVIDYPIDMLYEDLFNMVNTGASQYASLLKEILTLNDLSELLPYSNRALEFAVDLEKMRPTSALHHIDEYVMPNGYLDDLLSTSMNKVAQYLDDGIISNEHSTMVGKYYVVGLDNLTSSEKSIINSYLENPSFAPATDTYDYQIPSEENLYNIVIEQVTEQLISHVNPIEVTLTTDQIDRALSQAKAIGNVFVLTSRNIDNVHIANYIAIDRVTSIVDTEDDSLFLGLSVNFNGYPTMLTLKTKMDFTYSNFADARFIVENMYVGDYVIGEECREEYMQLISNAISEGAFDDTFTFGIEAGNLYLKINLNNLLYGQGITEASGYTVDYVFNTQTASTPGSLTIRATNHNG